MGLEPSEHFETLLESTSLFVEADIDTCLRDASLASKVIAFFRKPDPHVDSFMRITPRVMQTPLIVIDAAGPNARRALTRLATALENVEIRYHIWSWRSVDSLADFDPAFGTFLLLDDRATQDEIEALISRTSPVPEGAHFRLLISASYDSLVKARSLDQLLGLSSDCRAMPVIGLDTTDGDPTTSGLRVLSALLMPLIHSRVGCVDWCDYALMFKYSSDSYTIASWADQAESTESSLITDTVYTLEPFHGKASVRSALCSRISDITYTMEQWEQLCSMACHMGFYDFEPGGVAVSAVEIREDGPPLPLGVCSFEIFSSHP